MKKLLKSEPVMCGAVALSLILAALITAGKLTLDDVSGFVDTFGKVLLIVGPVALGGWIRAKVTPTGKD